MTTGETTTPQSKQTKIVDDLLDEDPIHSGTLKYALVAFAGPQAAQKADQALFKIRGAFETIEEAKLHSERLMKIDDGFDTYVVEMYKWLVCCPEPAKIENQIYNEEYMNELMKGYKTEQDKAKQFFEQRTRELAEKARKGEDIPSSSSSSPAIRLTVEPSEQE